jgi:hypothetical protein
MRIAYRTGFSSSLDESCLYLPTTYGYVAMADKFSGEILESFDTGWGIIASPVHTSNNRVSCLCGYPLSNGLDVNITQYSICVFSKESKKRVARSRFTQNVPLKFTSNGQSQYLVSGLSLEEYASDCRFVRSSKMSTECSYEIVLTPNYVICSCKEGLVSFYKKSDLSLYTAVFVAPEILQPVAYKDDDVVVIQKNEVLRVSPDNKPVRLASTETEPMLSAYKDGYLYVSDRKGTICQIAL